MMIEMGMIMELEDGRQYTYDTFPLMLAITGAIVLISNIYPVLIIHAAIIGALMFPVAVFLNAAFNPPPIKRGR